MNSKAISEQLAQWREKLNKVKALHAENSARLHALDGQRKKHIMPARVDRDEKHANALRDLDASRAPLQNEISADAEAIAEIEGAIAQLESELNATQSAEKRERVAAAVEARIKDPRAARILALSQQLKDELDGLRAQQHETRSMLHEFDAQLAERARRSVELFERTIVDCVLLDLGDRNPMAMNSEHVRSIRQLRREGPEAIARRSFEMVARAVRRHGTPEQQPAQAPPKHEGTPYTVPEEVA